MVYQLMCRTCNSEQTEVPLNSMQDKIIWKTKLFLFCFDMCILHVFRKYIEEYNYVYTTAQFGSIYSKSHHIDQMNNYTIHKQQLKYFTSDIFISDIITSDIFTFDIIIPLAFLPLTV